MSTAQLTDQQKHADAVHKRLMGKQPEPRRIMKIERQPKPIIDHVLVEDSPSDNDPDWRMGVKLVLRAFNENMRRVRGSNRDAQIVLCRAAMARYLRDKRGWSLPRIGEYMNRDHTSIYHLLNPENRAVKYQERKRIREAAWDAVK